MQQPSLFQRAKQTEAASFQKHDISQFIPPEMKDIVDRVVAAGMKIMYSADMKDDVQKEIARDAPTGQKMAESVVGLLLMLDKKSGSGIPNAALFPVAMKLLDEASDILTAAGQPVTQEDYSDAARRMFVLIGQKLGATPDQMMEAANSAAPGDDENAEQETGEDPAADVQDPGTQPLQKVMQ